MIASRLFSILGSGTSSQRMSASLIGHSGSSAFQTIHHCSVDVAHGLVLLFGIGTKALPSWDSKTGWNNLYHGLTVKVTAGSKRNCELTSSIVPRGTSFHRSVELEVPSYRIWFCAVFMLLPRLVPESSGTRCRQPRCGA